MTLEEQLFDLYGGLHRARGKNELLKTIDEKGKRKSRNQTVHSTYAVENWTDHLDGRIGLGVIPITDDATCNWGAIDIDIYPLDLVKLEQDVAKLDLPFVVLKTKSGGAHLTAYFEQFEPCVAVRSKMAEAAVVLGLGERELYPKQVKLANATDVGNWLNMPYFNNNNEPSARHAIINGEPATIEEFLAKAAAIRLKSVEDFVIPALTTELLDGPPCLQTFVLEKAGPGERNTVLFNLGVYARLKWESEWETKIEDFNRDMIDPPLNHREVGAIVKSLEKKNYVFTCNNPPICNHCNREACKGREFGITAFQHVDIGVVLDSISKMNSEPPMWILSLEGIRAEVETEELLDQGKFRKVCVNVLNKIPGRMKAEEWDKFIRNKLAAIEIIDMPVETRVSDLAIQLLPKFFESTPAARHSSEIPLGRWITEDGFHLLRGSDFIKYLDRNSVVIDSRKLWSVLTTYGVTSKLMRNIELWVVPAAMYTPTEKKYPKVQVPTKDNY